MLHVMPAEFYVIPADDLRPWQRLLIGAAIILERDGWCQNVFHDDDGQHCPIGAMESVRQSSGFMAIDRESAEHHLRKVIKSSIISWNDQAGRTKSEVIDALIHAAGNVPVNNVVDISHLVA